MQAKPSSVRRSLVISRTQSITFAFAFLAITFAVSIAMVVNRDTVKVSQELAVESLMKSPTNSTVSLRDFHRSESVNGVKKWDVIADKGDYFPEKSFAKLVKPVISFHVKSDSANKIGVKAKNIASAKGLRKRSTKKKAKIGSKVITMDAPLGNVTFSGRSLAVAEAEGGVVINHPDGTVLTTSKARFDGVTKNIIAPQKAEVVGAGFKTTGNTMTVNTESSIATFDGGVTSVFGKKGTKVK